MKGKKHHFSSREECLRHELLAGAFKFWYLDFFRTESTIVFSWLHQETTKELSPVNPVYPVKKYFDQFLDNYKLTCNIRISGSMRSR